MLYLLEDGFRGGCFPFVKLASKTGQSVNGVYYLEGIILQILQKWSILRFEGSVRIFQAIEKGGTYNCFSNWYIPFTK